MDQLLIFEFPQNALSQREQRIASIGFKKRQRGIPPSIVLLRETSIAVTTTEDRFSTSTANFRETKWNTRNQKVERQGRQRWKVESIGTYRNPPSCFVKLVAEYETCKSKFWELVRVSDRRNTIPSLESLNLHLWNHCKGCSIFNFSYVIFESSLFLS